MNSDNLILPFQFGFFFFLMIAVARTSSTMLNRRDDSGHPRLVPDFSMKAFAFSVTEYYIGRGSVISRLYCLEYMFLLKPPR